MPASDFIPGLIRPQGRSTSFISGFSVAATLAVIAVARIAFQTPSCPKTIPSPRVTQLPKLSKDDIARLPYPPDVFPGARDVSSPYGTTRVYEWGPVDGRKVLLVHGISTPCLALGGIAHALVERGCRVLLYDLWGRGYSDGVDLPHDDRLYSTQILLAITSSPIAWTPGRFSVIGYSLGGGIAADFARWFPDMIESVVLLAPAGLIRHHHFDCQSRLMYSGILPESLLQWIIRRRLSGSIGGNDKKLQPAEAAITEEIKGARDHDFESHPLSKSHPDITVGSAIQWQVQNHEGFLTSFISSIKYASIEGKHEVWRKLGLRSDKVLIFAGTKDPLVVAHELEPDAAEVIGLDKVVFRIMEAGHEFPITMADEVVRQISEVWHI